MVYFYIFIIIQVVVESLPVSSSTHLMVAGTIATLLGGYYSDQYVLFMSQYGHHIAAIDHMLHGLTAIIVALFFYPQCFFLLHNWRRCFFIILKLLVLSGIADTVTVCFFYLFKVYPFSVPLGYGLLITVGLLYSLKWCALKGGRVFDYRSALVLGCVQGLALLPGISRFAIVYVASRWCGFDARKGLAVTWMIFWPLMVAASAQGVYNLAREQVLFSLLTGGQVLLVIVGATVLGYGAFCYAARCAYNNTFWQFSWYVAALALLAICI
ncbi:MAG: undecaprenyl-diphosphate phosphatase [Candidatus Dependentiae bacterium]|nr:undecaprenyl-diphosphate phosphatase [Candidatus Dependentiae bacterium]